MSQNDFRLLLSNLVKSNRLSKNYLDFFDQEQSNLNIHFQKTKNNISYIGILFSFYFFQSIHEKIKDLEDITNLINETALKFDSNKISKEEAKIEITILVEKKLRTKVFVDENKSKLDSMIYSTNRSSFDIDNLMAFLNKKNILIPSQVKELSLKYLNSFEKDKNHIIDLKNGLLKNSHLKEELNDIFIFIDKLIENVDNRRILIDYASFQEEKNFGKLLPLFEDFFSSFEMTTEPDLKFDLDITDTLADRNNLSYFFQPNEQIENFDHKQSINSLIQPETSESTSSHSLYKLPSLNENPWDIVGAIAINPVNKGIGIAGYPFINDKSEKIYLSIEIEQEISLEDSENLYHQAQSLRLTDISDKTQARRETLITEISNTLDIPIELALYPSIINEYLTRTNISIDFEILKKKLRIEYYPLESIKFDKLNHVLIIPDDLEPIYSASNMKLFSSPKIGTSCVNKTISLWNNYIIGKIMNEIQLFSNYYLLIELDYPSYFILERLYLKLARNSENKNESNDLWKLRFTISKTLDIFEAESLLLENIWKFIWHEKIPVLPYDLFTSFIGLTPSGGVIKDTIGRETIQLARGLAVDSALSQFKDVHGLLYSIQSKNLHIGKLIGFRIDSESKKLILVYTTLNEIEILKKMNRDYSQSNLSKLAKRISKALSIPVEDTEAIFHPRNLLTYLLYYSIQFNTVIDFTDVHEIVTWLENEFEFKYCDLDNILKIEKNSIYVK